MPPDRPNVLWICTDQQRWDTLGSYGNEFVDTPRLDRLAAEGVRFDRTFCQNPVCAPSRASFLTGRYPRTTGVRQNGQDIPDTEVTIPTQFNQAGYNCGLAGKLHVSACSADHPDGRITEPRIDDGYDVYHWSHAPHHDVPTNAYQQWLADHDVTYETADFDGPVQLFEPGGEYHQTTWCAERTIDFVEDAANRDSPWLFSVHPFDPHPPFDPPREYLDPYLDRLEEIPIPDSVDEDLTAKPGFQDSARQSTEFQLGPDGTTWSDREHRLARAGYWAMCDLIDDQVGRMLDALDATGQREDTIVVFTSDHGQLMGEHGLYNKGPYLYEESLRVPLILAGAGIEAGIESDALVELVDVGPTLLDCAGIDPHPGVQGRSLHPILNGERDPDDHRESVYAEHYNASWRPGMQDDPEDIPTAEWYDPVYQTAIRTDRHKLVRVHGPDEGELYDLREDPGERENRWADPDYSDVKTDLLARMADRMAETADPLPERFTRY